MVIPLQVVAGFFESFLPSSASGVRPAKARVVIEACKARFFCVVMGIDEGKWFNQCVEDKKNMIPNFSLMHNSSAGILTAAVLGSACWHCRSKARG